MGQFLPDRLFWAREEARARGDDAETPTPRADARGSHCDRASPRARGRLRGLYAVTPDLADTARLARAGRRGDRRRRAGAIQYRNKTAARALRAAQAARSPALCRARGALFIVNDDAALARDVGADGVHLGEDDGERGCRARDRWARAR